MTYVHRNVKRRMALEGVKRHTRFSTYSWWRPGVYLSLIIVDCDQGNIVALFGPKKSGKDLRPQRLQVGLSLTNPHAIGSLLGCNHIFATSFSWVQTLVPSMLSRWPWCHFYFILFFIFFVVTKMTSVAFWSAMVDGVGDEPHGLYCLLTIAARRFGRHRIGPRSIGGCSSFWSVYSSSLCNLYLENFRFPQTTPTDDAWIFIVSCTAKSSRQYLQRRKL